MKFEFKLILKLKLLRKFQDSYNLKYYYLFYYLNKRIQTEQI